MGNNAAGAALAAIFGFIIIYLKIQEQIWLRQREHQRVHHSENVLTKKEKLAKLQQTLPLQVWKGDGNNSLVIDVETSQLEPRREQDNNLNDHFDAKDFSKPKLVKDEDEGVQNNNNGKRDRSNECPICLLSFEDGCSTCYSNNPSCSHIFHYECMIEWLMRHDECPCCRAPYLIETV